jgi:hypothetical protein
MATSLEHIDFTTIPDTHKGDLRNGWYRHPSGLYLSPLAIAKHRMAGHPPTQFTYDRWRHGGWYVHETMWPNGARAGRRILRHSATRQLRRHLATNPDRSGLG